MAAVVVVGVPVCKVTQTTLTNEIDPATGVNRALASFCPYCLLIAVNCPVAMHPQAAEGTIIHDRHIHTHIHTRNCMNLHLHLHIHSYILYIYDCRVTVCTFIGLEAGMQALRLSDVPPATLLDPAGGH